MAEVRIANLKKSFGAVEVQASYTPVLEAAAYPWTTIRTIALGVGALMLLLTRLPTGPVMIAGSKAQNERYVAPIAEGSQRAAFCLSEPQAGSSLSDVLTRAVPDGPEHASDPLGPRYRLRGNKMWISAGEHELTENIIHLVLAKIPDANGQLVPGVKGISLFIVPKKLVDVNGQLTGERNDVALAGLNHKCGWRGTTNTLLNFGEGKFPVRGGGGGPDGHGAQRVDVPLGPRATAPQFASRIDRTDLALRVQAPDAVPLPDEDAAVGRHVHREPGFHQVAAQALAQGGLVLLAHRIPGVGDHDVGAGVVEAGLVGHARSSRCNARRSQADSQKLVVLPCSDRWAAMASAVGSPPTITSRGTGYAGMLPDTIHIYRVPILRMCRSEEEVVEEVRHTVVHEVAHHFGISDERLHELGAY